MIAAKEIVGHGRVVTWVRTTFMTPKQIANSEYYKDLNKFVNAMPKINTLTIEYVKEQINWDDMKERSVEDDELEQIRSLARRKAK